MLLGASVKLKTKTDEIEKAANKRKNTPKKRSLGVAVEVNGLIFMRSMMPNVTGQGTRHLVAGTLDPLVRSVIFLFGTNPASV